MSKMKGRRLTWFRFYTEALDDPKVQRLPPHLFKTWVNLLCLAATADGRLPSVDDIAFKLRLSAADSQSHIDDLIGAGLVDIMPDGRLVPHNWETRQFASDTSTDRVRKHRKKKAVTPCNVSYVVTETPPETETDTESETESIPPLPPSEGGDEASKIHAALTANQFQPDGIIFNAGRLLLVNGTRQLWLDRLGSDEALDLALIEIQGEIENSRSRTPMAARVEAALARRARTKLDQDQRYAKAVSNRAKPTTAGQPAWLAERNQREREAKAILEKMGTEGAAS